MVRGFKCDSAWLLVNSRMNSLTSGLVECEIISNSSSSWNKVSVPMFHYSGLYVLTVLVYRSVLKFGILLTGV